MSVQLSAQDFLSRAEQQVLFHARSLNRKPAFRGEQLDDIAQDLRVALPQKFPQYDPTRGAMSTFAGQVLQTASGMLLRARRRQKRIAQRGTVSLQTQCRDDDSAGELSDFLSRADQQRRCGSEQVDPIERLAQTDELDGVIALLSPADASVATVLRDADSVIDAADALKVHRQVVYRTLDHLKAAVKDSSGQS